MATTTTRTVAVAVDAEPATTSSLTAETWAQIEAISDQVRRALECPVCLTLATVMASLCANGHAVCHTCVVKLWSRDTTQHCPMCRSPMDLRASTAMTVKLTEFTERVRLACDYRRFGCHRLYFVRDILEHERVCAYKPNVECLASTCQWLGTYDQLQEHVLHAHADVFVEATVNHEITYRFVHSYTE
ncbi:TRAF-like,Seven-in-absentia protein, TRAF-like domain,Zinc finger, RING/FYVE/PHD-type,Zinc finger, RING- [Cinara cedri]|uniref:TRAF-like,Seven-in-absentia protein, TRAF-like domain,Zinc finger, RING/FYVE/PHD-type,Zinc finger, RING n=1 Tax=Cinara cedri TaxID=506608 RepID=A0A5E4N939_9HEMI|nr:TRAF-like,Seven-in-absentia protein, TRAF-like domain,Zinc finger, RING/FYVE/PHD-type,Zinc finger, RING- [Cinara cedri]